METRSAKRRKMLSLECESSASAGTGEGIDHISDLPDDVLHCILGFLPLEMIARMSLLSKRWSQIWQTFPDLDFTTVRQKSGDDLEAVNNLIRSKSRRYRFDRQRVRNFLYLYDRDFISPVLSLRDKGSDLRALRFGAYLSFTCLNKLIRQALRQNVKELDLEFATEDYFNVPKCIISSESLQVLRFKSQFPGFRLPLSVMRGGFRSLQVLSLSLMLIEGEMDIFKDSVFPVLKKLSLSECMDLRRIKVSCSALEDMTLEKCYELDTLDVSGPRLQRLRVASCFRSLRGKSSVKVDAPRLCTVEWEQNYLTDDCSLQNLTGLHQASWLFLHGLTKLDEVIPATKLRAAWNFLHGISHVQCLKLDTLCMKLMQLLAAKNYGPVLPFINLESLEIQTALTRSIAPALRLLFKSSPSLHTLIVNIADQCIYNPRNERKMQDKDIWDVTYSEEEKYWEAETSAMKLLVENLKVVKIRGFMGWKAEVNLAKFLLRHGKALEEMVLCSGNKDSRVKEKIKSQMTGFFETASDAKISFE